MIQSGPCLLSAPGHLTPPETYAGARHEAPPLLVQLQQLSKEKQRVEAELQSCQEAEQEAQERVCRYVTALPQVVTGLS